MSSAQVGRLTLQIFVWFEALVNRLDYYGKPVLVLLTMTRRPLQKVAAFCHKCEAIVWNSQKFSDIAGRGVANLKI